jgi:hypothetical protein
MPECFVKCFFKNTGLAGRALRKEGMSYCIEDHRLLANESIEEHVHENQNEWIIFPPGNGKFEIIIDGKSEIVKLDPQTMRVHSGQTHSFRACTSVFYTLMRDGLD